MVRNLRESDRGGLVPPESLFQRFDGVMLDAMNTIFVAKAGRFALYQELLGTLGINANIVDVERVYKEKRAFYEAEAARIRDQGGNPDTGVQLWSRINGAIIQELAPEYFSNIMEIGRWVYEEFMGNPRYFKVPETMREFLETIHGRLRIMIASNQEQAKVMRSVSHFGLERMVDDIFTSEEMGYEKPDPRFFQAVLKGAGFNPARLLMVGNNIKNDVEGAKSVGIHEAVLLDWDNKLPDEKGVRRVTDPNQLLVMQFK